MSPASTAAANSVVAKPAPKNTVCDGSGAATVSASSQAAPPDVVIRIEEPAPKKAKVSYDVAEKPLAMRGTVPEDAKKPAVVVLNKMGVPAGAASKAAEKTDAKDGASKLGPGNAFSAASAKAMNSTAPLPLPFHPLPYGAPPMFFPGQPLPVFGMPPLGRPYIPPPFPSPAMAPALRTTQYPVDKTEMFRRPYLLAQVEAKKGHTSTAATYGKQFQKHKLPVPRQVEEKAKLNPSFRRSQRVIKKPPPPPKTTATTLKTKLPTGTKRKRTKKKDESTTKAVLKNKVTFIPVEKMKLDPLDFELGGTKAPADFKLSSQLISVLGFAFVRLTLNPVVQGRWYTAHCIASMLQKRHDFEDSLSFEVTKLDAAIDSRFHCIKGDEELAKRTGVFRMTQEIHLPICYGMETIFYYIASKPRSPPDWNQTPFGKDKTKKFPRRNEWNEFFEKANKMPAVFKKVYRSNPPDEVDRRLELLHEIRALGKRKEMQSTEDKKKEAEAKRVEQYWTKEDSKQLFCPREGERTDEALRRRLQKLENVINDYEGFRQIISDEDNAEYDNLIDSEHKDEREFILQQIFALRHKATCLRMAYKLALERCGKSTGKVSVWKTCCHDVLTGLGLDCGKSKNLITLYNIQFREHERFKLMLTLPRGRGHRLKVPLRLRKLRSAAGEQDEDEGVDHEIDEEIAEFMAHRSH